MMAIRKVVIIKGIGVKAEEYGKVEARPEPRKPKSDNAEDVVSTINAEIHGNFDDVTSGDVINAETITRK